MASITIRKFDDSAKAKLRIRAAQNGRSMEEEARAILEGVVDLRPLAPAATWRKESAAFLNLWVASNSIFRRGA